ncbi:MAG: anhydro-N-acetylmuramic acid kinase [Bacteroidales bacterium]|nr:anhydro-N-acetylmuramic acid kinase [Bacteroidales bacterium]
MPSLLQEKKTSYTGIGVMSGTSLDGLDICLCKFTRKEPLGWDYSILKAETQAYPLELKKQLEQSPGYTGEQLTQFDYHYGHWIGNAVNQFLENTEGLPSFVASHGHTIFHNPKQGYTLQIGKGAAIAAKTGIPCVSDFRSSDVSRGGQGAPLVPIGDKLLFSEYDICLNLGGIANLSFNDNHQQRIAYDICPCNMILNYLAQLQGAEYDKDGQLGAKGSININLLNALNELDYYKTTHPKSLGREWFESNILELINNTECSIADKLRTAYEHIAHQITTVTNSTEGKNLLITGGGAKNKFLASRITEKSKKEVIIPDTLTIDFKEALIFAFLGVLHFEQSNGALTSVTGAYNDSICGCLYY